MNQHELILLSPYRYPAQYPMTMSDEDMASWLNGFTLLWHPALLWGAAVAPRCDTTYDHETPKAGVVYALPETPPTYLPDNWEERVKQAGSLVFKATPDRAGTLANLHAALSAAGAPEFGWKPGLALHPDSLGPFFGIAWGHLLLASLSEAMEHENLLDVAAFWKDVQNAVALLGASASGVASTPPPAPQAEESSALVDAAAAASPQAADSDAPAPIAEAPKSQAADSDAPAPIAEAPKSPVECLQSAASKLLTAREVLYPVGIHLLDASFLDEATMAHGWPAALDFGVPINFIAPTAMLEKLAEHAPNRFAQLRSAVQTGGAEICGGQYLEREDCVLPIDSQLWNLRYGLDRAKELLGAEIRVFARRRFGYHPHLPLLLSSNGLTKALFLTFDEYSGLPNYSNVVVSWPSPDGKQVDAFARQPKYADSVETFFNLGHFWFKTTREDHVATIFILHRDKPTAVWYRDLMELARLGPVLGQWTTFSHYLTAVSAGEYPSMTTADDFHFDFLSERIDAKNDEPVGAFPRHLRTRRRIDACWTYAALHRSLAGARDTLDVSDELRAIEKVAETTYSAPPELEGLERRITTALADRLQARAEPNQPGYLILNPCGFARRAALELDGGKHPLPIAGIVKACQLDNGKLRTVIEIPALGFAWLPREGPPGTPPMVVKMRLGDQQARMIRNDVFEVEVDAHTGGIKAIRDHKTKVNRLGQQLVFNPGSKMVAKEITVTGVGPALAEVVSEGLIVGEQGQPFAGYRQRLRLWLGRPLLEIRIEITPQQPCAGYGWHAYFGSRFAWRDERATFVRGFNGMGYVSNHPRPQSPDYLDIRTPPLSTTILTGGLPFHQRLGGRMCDVILMPEGEKTTVFEMGIALDRPVPMQTAWGYTSPLAIVPTTKGPPHIGASGWLFHVDAPNLLLTRMTPGTLDENLHRSAACGVAEGPATPQAAEVADAITARLMECANYSGLAEFRCVRDPQRATVLSANGQFLVEANRSGDVVHLEVTPNDLVHVQVEFSLPPAPPVAAPAEDGSTPAD
ncbi:MAG: hypothetical protein HYR84_16735 [Planctomycetes bacterium]|nr:hypothetical protein [Planctomycetota bacterium]